MTLRLESEGLSLTLMGVEHDAPLITARAYFSEQPIPKGVTLSDAEHTVTLPHSLEASLFFVCDEPLSNRLDAPLIFVTTGAKHV